jgi:hypothetical protein
MTDADGTLLALDLDRPGGPPSPARAGRRGDPARPPPNCRRLAAARADECVLLADPEQPGGAGSPPLLGHLQAAADLALLPGDRLVTAGNDDGTLRVRALGLEELLGLASRRAGSDFSAAEWGRFLHDEPYRATFPEHPTP